MEIILKYEGGYVFDKQDPGGETKYGISKKAFPETDIKNLTLEEAKKIYKDKYWDKINGDALPYHIALSVFDFSVNAGTGMASLVLQKCLCVLADGHIGGKTVRSAAETDKITIINKYAVERVMFYTSLPTFKTYGHGWVARTLSTLTLALKG